MFHKRILGEPVAPGWDAPVLPNLLHGTRLSNQFLLCICFLSISVCLSLSLSLFLSLVFSFVRSLFPSSPWHSPFNLFEVMFFLSCLYLFFSLSFFFIIRVFMALACLNFRGITSLSFYSCALSLLFSLYLSMTEISWIFAC